MASSSRVFKSETTGDTLVLTPARAFAAARDAELRDAYNEVYRQLMNGSARHLIIDFSHVSYFGSTFVGMMIRLAKKASENQGRTVLCHMNDDVRSILKQLMLLENNRADLFWEQADTRETAMELLQAADDGNAD